MRYLSLFSGMEAAHLAWHPLGWECVGVAEIDPRACELLAHRLPHVPNLGSVTDITDEDIAALGRLDVVIGGSPCQDLSVAGKRRGLAGARSGLFHQQLRLFHAARHFCGARWLVWENVPGAFSSNRGRDFAVVVGDMAGLDLAVPRDGWGNEGVAVGENGLVEWSVLDAQWFGVAQRRRRVFAVLDTGNWTDRSPILLERDSLRGDSAPRREAGEKPAPCLSARTSGGGGLGTDFDCDGGLIPELARCVTTGEAKRQYWETCTIIPATAHTLRADGFDASEDGTGRGTPIVPIVFDTTQITSSTNRSNPQPGDPCHTLAKGSHAPAIAFSCKDHGADAGDISPTLRSMGHDGSHANAGGQVAVAFVHQGGGIQTTLGYDPEAGTAPTLSVCQTPAVHTAMAVRRLTPRECERLQGVEDDWTLVPSGKKGKPMADGPRYKMLGNSFAVPVIRWIGQQIDRAARESMKREAA